MPKTVLQCLIVVIAVGGATRAVAQEFADDSTLRGEQLFPYDDLDPWKHGYIQVMPFYGGFHSFRPYNYKHVYAQSAQATQWGIPAQAPYSQQFWHQYERRTDLSMTEYAPNDPSVAPAGFQSGNAVEPVLAPPALPAQVYGQTPQVYQTPVQNTPQQYAPQQAPAFGQSVPQTYGYPASPQYSGQMWTPAQ